MIQILNKRSSTHQNWCEDNYFVKETDEFIIGAVLDGCSTGIDSQFASNFLKKCFDYQSKFYDHIPKDEFGLFYSIRTHLKNIKFEVDLNDLQLLSTIVYFTYHKKKKKLNVRFFGDGVIYVDGNEIINDENNIPDYFAYHLSDSSDQFEEYFNSRKYLTFENVNDFAICSDGIHSLINLKNPHIKKEVAINFLIIDEQWKRLENGLNKKFNILTNRDEEIKRSEELYWWEIKDDLTIIKFNSN